MGSSRCQAGKKEKGQVILSIKKKIPLKSKGKSIWEKTQDEW